MQRESDPSAEGKTPAKGCTLYLFIGLGICLVLIISGFGLFLFTDKEGYVANITTETIFVVLTLFVINTVANNRENRRLSYEKLRDDQRSRAAKLKDIVMDCGSGTSEISKAAFSRLTKMKHLPIRYGDEAYRYFVEYGLSESVISDISLPQVYLADVNLRSSHLARVKLRSSRLMGV